jgi:hypothetical protein
MLKNSQRSLQYRCPDIQLYATVSVLYNIADEKPSDMWRLAFNSNVETFKIFLIDFRTVLT